MEHDRAAVRVGLRLAYFDPANVRNPNVHMSVKAGCQNAKASPGRERRRRREGDSRGRGCVDQEERRGREGGTSTRR